MDANEIKPVVEAVLFASEKSMPLDQIRQAFEEGVNSEDIRKALELLKKEYETPERGFRLAEVGGGYQLISDARFAAYLKRLYQAREKKKLSQASLETLSVIAYRQPVTRAEIEAIRGVNVDGAVKTLLEKGLIRIAGRKDVPGRPMLYGTTKEFLDHFGLNSPKELPPLTEYSEKDIADHLLPPEMAAARQNEKPAPPEEAPSQDEVTDETGRS